MSYPDGRLMLRSQREGQVSRFRTWVLLVVPLAAILFQIYVPLFFQFLGFLEMPLLVVVYFALMQRSQINGLFIGAFVGLAQDSLTKNPLGAYGIVKTLVGYFAASVGAPLRRRARPCPPAALLFLLYLSPLPVLGDGPGDARPQSSLRSAKDAGVGRAERRRRSQPLPLSRPPQRKRLSGKMGWEPRAGLQ